jgi:hypothetical protein
LTAKLLLDLISTVIHGVKVKVMSQPKVTRPVWLGNKQPCESQEATKREIITARIRVRVTLRFVVYCQSVHLGVKPLVTHDQRFFQLNA